MQDRTRAIIVAILSGMILASAPLSETIIVAVGAIAAGLCGIYFAFSLVE